MNAPNFWDDSTSANKLMGELKFLKSCTEPFDVLNAKIKENLELLEISEGDSGMLKQLEADIEPAGVDRADIPDPAPGAMLALERSETGHRMDHGGLTNRIIPYSGGSRY